jgi:hypothetical protein
MKRRGKLFLTKVGSLLCSHLGIIRIITPVSYSLLDDLGKARLWDWVKVQSLQKEFKTRLAYLRGYFFSLKH